jgi:hypothetical protein
MCATVTKHWFQCNRFISQNLDHGARASDHTYFASPIEARVLHQCASFAIFFKNLRNRSLQQFAVESLVLQQIPKLAPASAKDGFTEHFIHPNSSVYIEMKHCQKYRNKTAGRCAANEIVMEIGVRRRGGGYQAPEYIPCGEEGCISFATTTIKA